MKLIAFLNKIITIGLLLTLLLPLVTGPFLVFPYITGKNIAFRIITEIIFTLYLLVIALNKKNRHLISPISIAVFVFILLLLLTTLTGINPARSFFSNFERMEGLITFIHLAAWFVVATGTFQNRKQWEFFFKSNLVIGAMVSAYSILQVIHILSVDQGRIAAMFGNPIYLSYYMYFNIFLAIFFLVSTLKQINLLKKQVNLFSTQPSWIRALDSKFKICFNILTNYRICYNTLKLLIQRSWARIKKLSWQSIGYATLTAAQIFVLFQTATRGAILGLLFGAMIAAFYIIITGRKRIWQRRLAIILLLVASLSITAFLTLRNTDFLKNNLLLGRFISISVKNLAQDIERVAIWKIAGQGIKERPLLGWGLENFDAVFDKYYDPRLAVHTQWFDRAHNTYLEWWLVSGIFGLLAYLGIFASAFYIVIKSAATSFAVAEKAVLIGLLAGYMAINFFDFDNLLSYLAFFSILAFIHAISKTEADLPNKPLQQKFKGNTAMQSVIISLIQQSCEVPCKGGIRALDSKFKICSEKLTNFRICYKALIIISGIILIVAINGKPIYSLLMMNKAFTKQPEGYVKNLEYFQKALIPKTFGRAEICRRLSDIAVQFNSANNSKISESAKEKYFAVTNSEMQKLALQEPVYARNETAFGVFLHCFAHYDEALQHLTKAHLLTPRKPAILIEMALVYLSNQQNEKALYTARQAFELNPDFEEARKIYALSAIVGNKLEVARYLLLAVYQTMAVDDDRFIMAYSLTKQWQQVIDIYSSRLEKNPAVLTTRVNLAQAFLQIGERAKAVEQIEAAMRYNPSFVGQGSLMIQKIGDAGQ